MSVLKANDLVMHFLLVGYAAKRFSPE